MKWEHVEFSELFRVKHGFAFKSQFFDTTGPFALLTPGNFHETGGFRDQGDKQKYYTGDVPSAFVLDQGDLLVAMTEQADGLLGSSAWIPESDRYLHNQRLGLVTQLNEERIDKRFLYYLFNIREVRHQISGSASGTKVRHTSPERIGRVKAQIPQLPAQRKIAATLVSYDGLIENNRRRMALLEEAAKRLYEEWFVRLRFPGYEHTRIVDGVPEGWMSKPLGESAEFRLGKMLDQRKNKGDLLPYLANLNVRWGKFDLGNLREMRFEDDEFDAFGLKYGDIAMCEGGEPGRCAIWQDQLPRMMIQKAIHRIRARQDVSHLYLYHSLRHKGQSGQLAGLFTGATIKHLPREKLAKVNVTIPSAGLMELFVEQAGPIHSQINVLETANRRARAARDLLLPRLMSGEIVV